MIGVIIPYFQKTPGLLKRSLLSVAAQEGAAAKRVYIVDDESPAPVEMELAGLPQDFRERIEILRQKNAGPGAARNLALDHLDDGITIIAYLDSDDAWNGNHLANIASAFDAGAEFYFANYHRQDAPRSLFDKMGYVPEGREVAAGTGMIWISARAMFENLLMYSPIGTSTVAYRRNLFGSLRFDPMFRSAGEDKMLWAEILSQDPRTVVSTRTEVEYGKGVNIFAHGSWGDARAVRTSLDCARSQMVLSRRFAFPAAQRARNSAMCRQIDTDFWAAVFAMLRRGGGVPADLIASYLGMRPSAVLRVPRALARVVSRKIAAGPVNGMGR